MPYRDEDKPLAELIPPDRRKAHAIGLVLVSMVAGAALFALGSLTLDVLDGPHATKAPEPKDPGRITETSLPGPDGTRGLRTGRASIVHVWLQGCADCMPAFEAIRDLHAQGGFGVDAPELNVSYGKSDPAWADRFAVRTNLVWDVGGAAVVRPLGISTFTTLVLDERGYVVHRDRPDRPGYLEAVRRALREHGATSEAKPPRRLDKDDLDAVVARNTPAMRACWDRSSTSAREVSLSVRLVVDLEGAATEVTVQGGAPDLDDCVREGVLSWRFPRPLQPTPLVVPVRLTRS